MKKFFITLVSLALSVVTMAGNFVMLPYSGRAELEKHFSDSKSGFGSQESFLPTPNYHHKIHLLTC